MDLSATAQTLAVALHGTLPSTLAFWTETEVYSHMAAAVEIAGHSVAAFPEETTPITVTAGTAVYAIPERHAGLVDVSLDGLTLRPAMALALEALSITWAGDVGDTNRYTQDLVGEQQLQLYPSPATDGTMKLVRLTWPEDVTAAAPSIDAPAIIQDFVFFWTLADLRRMETDGQMLEVANWARGVADLLLKAMEAYWGKSS